MTARPREFRSEYVRRPQVRPTEARGLDRSEFGVFLFAAERFDRDHAALAVLLGLNGLRVTEACETNVEDLGFERGHRTLKILGKAASPPPSRSFHARPALSISPWVSGVKARSCDDATASASTDAPPIDGSRRSAGALVSVTCTRTCSARRSSLLLSTSSRSSPAAERLRRIDRIDRVHSAEVLAEWSGIKLS